MLYIFIYINIYNITPKSRYSHIYTYRLKKNCHLSSVTDLSVFATKRRFYEKCSM